MLFDNNTFYLFTDPMCPWCYAISKELDVFLQKYPEFKLEVILGGLRRNDPSLITPEKGKAIEKSWERVTAMSGVKFGEDIFSELTKEHFTYNTEEACRAVVTFRELQPNKTFSFLEDVHELFFIHGKDLRDLDSYTPLLHKYKVDQITFAARYYSDEMRKITYDDYALSKQVGAKNFPTLTFMQNGELNALSTGYRLAVDLEKVMEKILNT
ncbi:DsbA family protein [Sediminitomix flava]|uniref:DSBA-like thioredoxin domain-containing protein n=1 Tax=Sediminitomix flava TaxID=379075 RepID=A0A316A529_SEDFL|nr:DsbA family protein [Sediminitomix flava]PWJ44867.1 putative protein-disulfide isomerase [Sediminitomix flava]